MAHNASLREGTPGGAGTEAIGRTGRLGLRPEQTGRGRRSAQAESAEHSQRVMVPVKGGRLVDATHAVIAAIAYSIWEQRGGAPEENWTEAEEVLRKLIPVNGSAATRVRRAGQAADADPEAGRPR